MHPLNTPWVKVNMITPTEVKMIEIQPPKQYVQFCRTLNSYDHPPHFLKLECFDLFWIDKDMDVIMIKQQRDWKCFLMMNHWYNLEVYAVSARLTYGKTFEETEKFSFIDYLKERNVFNGVINFRSDQ